MAAFAAYSDADDKIFLEEAFAEAFIEGHPNVDQNSNLFRAVQFFSTHQSDTFICHVSHSTFQEILNYQSLNQCTRVFACFQMCSHTCVTVYSRPFIPVFAYARANSHWRPRDDASACMCARTSARQHSLTPERTYLLLRTNTAK